MSKTTDRLDRIERKLEELVLLMRLLVLQSGQDLPEETHAPLSPVYPEPPTYPPYYPPVMPGLPVPNNEPWTAPHPVTCEPAPDFAPTFTSSDTVGE